MTPSKKTYQSIYLTSLAFIAILVAAANVVIDHIASEESLMVKVNDIASRQRMLSERVARLLLEYAVEDDKEVQNNLVNLIKTSLKSFNQTHQYLIQGRLPDGGHIIFEDNIDSFFFGSLEYLDQKARIFIYNSREVLSKQWSPELIKSFYLTEVRKASKQSLHTSLENLASLYTKNSQSRILRLRIIVAFLLIGIIAVVIAVGAFVFRPLFQRIVNQEEMLHQLAYIDPLTNACNRRSFLGNADIEFGRSRRNQLPFSVLYIDVDYLKNINDTFGHAMGDIAIQEVSNVCQSNIRDIDILGRLGGDEFGILLPDCNLESATLTAERLRQGMISHTIPGITGEVPLSVSIGVAMLDDRDKNAFETINRADQNLYKAKRTGRNLIIAA